ncbi:response regulator transcription factor [Massilia sp. CT11-137]|uniref:response regulator transcription factor n=1 Tax=Massilia sp. CT11-137 TaxID=3393901 RepID=UPI0039B0AF11
MLRGRAGRRGRKDSAAAAHRAAPARGAAHALPPQGPRAGRRFRRGRAREVLQLVCVGKTNAAIGAILGISPWTVKVHVRNFMAKLNVSTRGHAAAMAMKNGLVST